MASDQADSYLGISGLRSHVVAFGVLPAYFAVWLLPHMFPALGGWFLFFLYVLSIPVALCVLLAMFVWGAGFLVAARVRDRPVRPLHRLLVAVSAVGALAFFSAVALGRVLPLPLPSGSYDLPFDSAEWKSEGAAAFRENDITPRQKMLGDLLERFEPSLTRSDLEELLGPPHPPDFPYGAAGSDLHYRTGPQRDAFFGLDSEWLLIYLDDSGRFSRYDIYVD